MSYGAESIFLTFDIFIKVGTFYILRASALSQVLESKKCWKYNSAGQLNWTLIYNNTENACIFIVLQGLFPWGVYAWTVSHLLLDILLCCGAIYRCLTYSVKSAETVLQYCRLAEYSEELKGVRWM